jgi:hypothetical protein
MSGARVLADGKTKFTVLTTKPANPAAPTATELNAGIDLSLDVLSSDFTFSATDSDKVPEKPLGQGGNANAIGASNFQAGFTLWRKFATGGGFDEASETGWAAVKVKGTTVWAYARQMDKEATATWTAADEIYLGAEITVDNFQRTDGTGFIKYRIPTEVQNGYPGIAVAAGA